MILSFENDLTLFGFHNVANQFILNHHSNGRTGADSRSWNRMMLNIMFEKENFVTSIKPWYRIPTREKSSPTDQRGDDNPDIERYMGHFEWTAAWMRQQNLYSIMVRNNLRSDNRGAVELSWSFPINGRFRGTVRYFNGYGESLISYDQSTQSLGVGFMISDWL